MQVESYQSRHLSLHYSSWGCPKVIDGKSEATMASFQKGPPRTWSEKMSLKSIYISRMTPQTAQYCSSSSQLLNKSQKASINSSLSLIIKSYFQREFPFAASICTSQTFSSLPFGLPTQSRRRLPIAA